MSQVMRQVVIVLLISLPMIIGLFLLGLFLAHMVSLAKEKQRKRWIRKVQTFIKVSVHREAYVRQQYGRLHDDIEAKIYDRLRVLRHPLGLKVLEELAAIPDENQQNHLRKMVLAPRLSTYCLKKLKSRDRASALVIVQIIGHLKLHAWIPYIHHFLHRYHEESDVQYLCCLTLAQLADAEGLIEFYQDSAYPIVLSFRHLQEIFDCFTGDSALFVASLLDQSSDNYIKRACIKTIGKHQLTKLAPKVMQFLYSDSQNEAFRIDAVRVLGQLKHRPAGPYIASLTSYHRFEVRVVVAEALYLIDAKQYFDFIFQLVFDEKWAVRYRAAQMLSQYPNTKEIKAKIVQAQDKYALEIFEFMCEQRHVFQGEVRV